MNSLNQMTNVSILDDKPLMKLIAMQESQSIKTTRHFGNGFKEYMKDGWQLRGDRLPWAKTFSNVAFNYGQVSLWGGINGHKKSMLLGQVMQWFAKITRVGIASFEMPVNSTMERMVTQSAGCLASNRFVDQWLDWSNNRIYLYDRLDTVPENQLLGAIYYMATACGCKHVMIDSLTKIGINLNDKGSEKRFMDKLSATAKVLDIHIHIVAHVRKPPQGGDDYKPTKFDVRGAGELTDLVDNVLLVWMDKKKEKLKNLYEMNPNALNESQLDYLNKPDQILTVAKQRYGRWEDNIALWFDNDSLQFTGDSSGQILPFDVTQTLAPFEPTFVLDGSNF